MIVYYFIIIFLVMCGLLWIIHWDREIHIKIKKIQWGILSICCFLNSVCIEYCFWQRNRTEKILLCVIAGGLIMACVTDCYMQQVYVFVWWITGGIALILMFYEKLSKQHNEFSYVSLILFILLQEYFFCKMYGRADCHAFVVCAMVQTSFLASMQEYLFHMALTFGILAFVQGFRGNIARNGNLKKAVPLLPYIVISFWGILIYYHFQ